MNSKKVLALSISQTFLPFGGLFPPLSLRQFLFIYPLIDSEGSQLRIGPCANDWTVLEY